MARSLSPEPDHVVAEVLSANSSGEAVGAPSVDPPMPD
jgi:hypothetical protein